MATARPSEAQALSPRHTAPPLLAPEGVFTFQAQQVCKVQ